MEIVEESVAALPEYGEIPMSFLVESRLRVEPIRNGLGGLALVEERVAPPYLKDYDGSPEQRPTSWPGRWDLSGWGILSAFDGTRRVGGAAVARRTPGMGDLEGRDDLALLWDIRVHPDRRGQGVGSRLFARAVTWAREKGCRQLKVETQNINVPACRFYARQGCALGAIHRYAYPDLPEEIQLLWYVDLQGDQSSL
ncbi:MAG: hypothetical protein A3F84_02825 [Candidatus Handelsmanbacteria bacterium RIFCSPLOWO2_12_FULL_64_10]|uniref:N-acetyltransferase domain-containing protein n=1 Tax=Handelsmanbacteria sp. (strain RIFCSPLOWO2_12_FULL_64_10) TaxID=1817868 RepID=A0A1F6CRY2_HANXR|nr:MAG: hypothetical protein A3F84_02825 [Candidatus Handelsmanbacteria bacterium RIFCSPLOWO2_12_FULL_64_10]